MINQKNKNISGRGFTLIELLIVIAIIGILSSVVLVSSRGGIDKAKRASAITTASSVLPELVTCADDGGFGITAAPTSAAYICCNAASGSIAACDGVGESRAGHSVKWPDITNTGWAYAAPIGTLSAGTYEYKLTKPGEVDITCSYATNGCI